MELTTSISWTVGLLGENGETWHHFFSGWEWSVNKDQRERGLMVALTKSLT